MKVIVKKFETTNNIKHYEILVEKEGRSNSVSLI